jgi:hypothetical protein
MTLIMQLDIFFITNNLNCANGITAAFRGRKFMKTPEVKYCRALEQSTQLTFLHLESLWVHSEPVFVNVYGAQESIPRNRLHQAM